MDYTAEQWSKLSSEELDAYFSEFKEVVTFTSKGLWYISICI